MADDKQQPKPEATARERFQARKRTAPRTAPATPRPASPTRAIEPGVIHYRIAEGLLTGAQKRAASAGIKLDVGQFPDLGTAAVQSDDPERIVRLTAHAVARVADRFTFLRKLSRHMEGTEKRAGILSDIFAVATAIYRRNPDAVEDLARQAAEEMQTRRAAQAATKNGGTVATGKTFTGKPKPGEVTNAP